METRPPPAQALRQLTCPQCRSALELDPYWAPWCESCDWGLDPIPAEDRDGRVARWWRRRLARAAEHEHARLLVDGVQARASLDAVVVPLLAVLVHLVTVALVAGVVLLALSPVWTGFRLALGGLALAVVFELLPRPAAEQHGVLLTRDTAPALYGLLDDAAARLGTTPPQRVRVSPKVNASWTRAGWRRTPVLELGLPLWAVLSGQEKVALLGHELGHEASGDLSRHLLVGSALDALDRWQYLLLPTSPLSGVRARRASPLVAVASWVLLVVLLPVVALLGTLAAALEQLSARAGLRAEHEADLLGARLAGRDQGAGLHRAVLGSDVLWFQLQVAVRNTPGCDVWEVARAHARSVPEHERRRQQRLAEQTLRRVDETHPPTARRIALLATLPDEPPLLVLSPEREAAVDAEVRRATRSVREALR